ncbi:MAG: hypothetical protein ACI4VQ_01500 [Clostridia bacterium]
MKKAKYEKLSLKLIGKILTVIVIILLSLISFVGIYTQDKNSMKNIVPKYELGMDIYGSRNIVIKVDDSTETKTYDAEGNLVTDIENAENVTEVEEPVNAPETLTTENYQAIKDILVQRLEYMNVSNYSIRLDEDTGDINIEIPENSVTDYIAQYTITKGEFKIIDSDTEEVLLTNSDLKETTVQYGSTTSGVTVYLSIQFNKEGAEKLKNISNTYIKSEDAEGNETTRNIKMTLDDETIIETYFEEEISNGLIQLSIGTSSDTSQIQTYLQQASNIAIFLNTEPMPITYKMEINRFVYSDITSNTIKAIVIVFVIVAALMAIYMIIRFHKNGIMGVITNIGFVAILLLALRLGNVTITLTGIFAVAVATIIEYLITMLILKEYNKAIDEEIIKMNIRGLFKKVTISLIPLEIIAITFALMKWEEIFSLGMVLFWAILIMIIYNLIILGIGLFKGKNAENKKSK